MLRPYLNTLSIIAVLTLKPQPTSYGTIVYWNLGKFKILPWVTQQQEIMTSFMHAQNNGNRRLVLKICVWETKGKEGDLNNMILMPISSKCSMVNYTDSDWKLKIGSKLWGSPPVGLHCNRVRVLVADWKDGNNMVWQDKMQENKASL